MVLTPGERVSPVLVCPTEMLPCETLGTVGDVVGDSVGASVLWEQSPELVSSKAFFSEISVTCPCKHRFVVKSQPHWNVVTPLPLSEPSSNIAEPYSSAITSSQSKEHLICKQGSVVGVSVGHDVVGEGVGETVGIRVGAEAVGAVVGNWLGADVEGLFDDVVGERVGESDGLLVGVAVVGVAVGV